MGLYVLPRIPLYVPHLPSTTYHPLSLLFIDFSWSFCMIPLYLCFFTYFDVVTVVRETNENNEHLVQRFKKSVRAARFIVEQKRNRYHKKKKTKIRIRQEAIKRAENRERRMRQQLVA